MTSHHLHYTEFLGPHLQGVAFGSYITAMVATMYPDSDMPGEAIHLASRVAHAYEGLAGLRNGKYYPYQGKADRKNVWTIGRGHVITANDRKYGIWVDGKRYAPWNGLTLEQVDILFAQDMSFRVKSCWDAIGQRGTSNQAGSWLDLKFNCPSALAPKSTPMRAWKANDLKGCAEGVMLYTKSNGQHQRGLFRRRGTNSLLLYTGEFFTAKTVPEEKELEARLKDAGIKYTKRF